MYPKYYKNAKRSCSTHLSGQIGNGLVFLADKLGDQVLFKPKYLFFWINLECTFPKISMPECMVSVYSTWDI